MWIVIILLQIVIFITGVRRLDRAGRWSWPMFGFALSFAAFEVLILVLPLKLGMDGNRYFVPVYVAAWLVAALNFVWFLRVCRKRREQDAGTGE